VTKVIWDEGFKRSYRRRIKDDPRLKKEILEKDENFFRGSVLSTIKDP